jgi:Endonuclease I
MPLLMWAQAPAGYYNNADGKTGATLKTALFNIIKTHTSVSYDGLYTVYTTSDNLPGSKVWDMYSIKADGTADYFYTQGQQKCGNYQKEGDCYNREHSLPQSWFNSASPMVSDAFHVYPTDGKVNGKRSNYPFGEVITASYTSSNGSMLGNSDPATGYSGTVFEPIDEFKGDFARTYFYMATCYEDKIASWVGNGSAGTILDGTSYPAFKTWYVQLLLKWSRQDPVSQKEIDRNNAIYAIQHNRNPYIDHSEYAEYVWGGETPSGVQVSNIALNPAHPNETNTVSISATVSTTKPISLVKLKWGTTSSITNEIPMTSTDGSNYTTTAAIPAQSVGSTIYYTVYAEDNEGGNKLTQTQTYTVANSVAPTNLLSVDFSSCLPAGWVTYSVASNKNWNCISNQYMEANGFNGDVASEDWLVTSKIDATNFNNVALTFNVKTKFTDTNYPNTLTVYYSTNYAGTGNPNAATWNLLSYTVPAANSNAFASSGSINLAAVDGKQFYIGFKYVSTGISSNSAALWDVDDVVVTATPGSNPINQAPSISSVQNLPANPEKGGNTTVTASVADADGSIKTVTLKYGINQANPDQSVAMAMQSGSTYTASFTFPQADKVYYKIEASDNLDLVTTSQIYTINSAVATNQLPAISNVSFSPNQPQENSVLSISATITDADGSITNATVYYGDASNNMPFQQTMQIQSGSTYKASFSIPQLTALYFKVTATDNQGGITSSTPTMVTLYTGIDATAAEKIEIYPNPAHQQFFVSSNSNSPINIGVYDLTGKKIIERKNQRSNQSIDISALTNGIYLIRISSENGMVTKKLTVSK